MKRAISIALAALFGVCTLTAPATAETEEKHLEVSTFWVTPSLDFSDSYTGWVCTRTGVGETLVKLNDEVKLEPWIADSWENVDELTWTFHIREGVTFHNGKPVDAAAVMASIQYAYDNNVRADTLLDMDSMSADGQTLTIRTREPNAALVFNLTEPLFCVFDVTCEDMVNCPQGTGPYKVAGFDTDTCIYLEKNDSYWDGEPGLDTITFSEIPDSEARVMALQSGETEMTVTLDNASLQLFENNDDYNVSVVIGERTNVTYMNHERPFTGDKVIREALSWAIDREAYAAGITGGEAATGMFPSSLPYDNASLTAYGCDPDKANQILDEAGYLDTDGDGVREVNGEKIHLEYYMSQAHGSSDTMLLAQAIQQDAAKIGIEIELLMTENLSDVLASGDFDMSSDNSNTAPTGDAQYFLSVRCSSAQGGGGDHGSNTGRYASEKMDAIISEMSSAFDAETRYSLAHEAAQLLLDDAAALYLTYVPMNTVSRSYVVGAEQPTVDYYMITKDLTIDR